MKLGTDIKRRAAELAADAAAVGLKVTREELERRMLAAVDAAQKQNGGRAPDMVAK